MIYDKEDISIEFIPYQLSHKTSYKLITIDFDYEHKFLDRTAIDALMQGIQKECELIFVKDGLITDSSIANVACFINNQWLTPKKPLLLGTTRSRLLNEKKLILADIEVEDFNKAEKIAFFNALTGFYELPLST